MLVLCIFLKILMVSDKMIDKALRIHKTITLKVVDPIADILKQMKKQKKNTIMMMYMKS